MNYIIEIIIELKDKGSPLLGSQRRCHADAFYPGLISIIAIIIVLNTIIGNRDISDMFPVTNCVCNDFGVPYMCDCG